MASAALPFDPIAEANRQWEAHGWGDAALGMAVVTSVMRVEQIFLQRVEQVLRPLDLTFARYEALMLLSFSRRGSLPLGKIGERLQVHPASVTNAIDRLERQGLVERSPHPDDGRKTLASITRKGRILATRATALVNNEVFLTFDMSNQDLDRLFQLLRQVRRSAGDFD
jgi:DNA-binding MarR family transcriptional regulator